MALDSNYDHCHGEVIHELDGNGNGEKKGGRKITQKLNIYSRQTKPKIKIPFNELGQPYGADATEFANFIGTLVRKHISLAKLDWRDVELEEQKSLVWDHLQAFYELDSTALSYVYNTSHTKWKEWKVDLKKTKFDPELTDEQLMRRWMRELVNVIGLPLLNIGDLQNLKLAVQERKRIVPS
ncbi:uncharacterized protein LOC100838372 isoform X1 [Brachypodium distachyon]|uniref:uncharacterized protein LOC100838372 isoform X1 n=1 Tax=Brachypodium distachyon TaxID=15368 RepID=UPI000D0E1AFA|nr:uncharacterized protein LOC100838372 isoform X1 [Brachypodium distachyon]|eukprot:XP_024315651.1 uncharacterized protein LOC100838372 isoform X1 [Brachypodium distachyon]